MDSRLKYALILLGGTLVLMFSGILLYLNNHLYAALWLVVVLGVLSGFSFSEIIRQGNHDEDMIKAARVACLLVYTVSVSVSTGYICKSWSVKIDNEAGVVYVLGKVSDKKKTLVHGRRQHLEFEATIKVPTFGLDGRDTIVYNYYGMDSNLGAPFPIKGDYVLMQYSVAWPDNISYSKLNDETVISFDKLKLKNEFPDTNFAFDEVFSTSFSKYESPVVVIPDGHELTGSDAMDYIRDYIKGKE